MFHLVSEVHTLYLELELWGLIFSPVENGGKATTNVTFLERPFCYFLVLKEQLTLNPSPRLFSALLPLFLIHIMHLNALCLFQHHGCHLLYRSNHFA